MRCEKFESRLNELLDERLPLSKAADAEEHLRQCSACRDLARAYESVLAGLQQAAIPPEPAGLTRRIVFEARRPSVIRPWVFLRHRRVAGGAMAFAAAAALLVAFGLSWLFNSAGRHDQALRGDAGSLADSDQPRPSDLAADQGAADDGPQSERRPTDIYDTKQIDATAVSSIPDATASLDVTHLNADELMRSLPGADWAQGVADGLEPVTKPTVGAISGFLHLWGVGDEGRRS